MKTPADFLPVTSAGDGYASDLELDAHADYPPPEPSGQEVADAFTNVSAPKGAILRSPPLTIRSPNEVLAIELDDSDNLLGDRLLAKCQHMTILGAGGIGKSRLLLQLAACQIIGRPFLGLETHGAGLSWLIIQGENSNRRLQFDLAKLREWCGKDWPQVEALLRIHTLENDLDGFLNLDSAENYSRIESVIGEHKPGVVGFDTLNNFAIGDPNNDNDMRDTCCFISRLVKTGDPNRASVTLHHALTGKAGIIKATGLERSGFGRNSKVLLAWTRGQINVSPGSADNNNLLVLSCGKCNNGKEFAPFAAKLNPATMIYELAEDFDLAGWAANIANPASKQRPKPTMDQFLSVFRRDPKNPRTCLLSAVQLREQLCRRGWDKNCAPALRDEAVGEGKLEVYHGARNEKLAGLPTMVQAFRKQKAEQDTILEQVPLTTKPPKTKCRKRKK